MVFEDLGEAIEDATLTPGCVIALSSNYAGEEYIGKHCFEFYKGHSYALTDFAEGSIGITYSVKTLPAVVKEPEPKGFRYETAREFAKGDAPAKLAVAGCFALAFVLALLAIAIAVE